MRYMRFVGICLAILMPLAIFGAERRGLRLSTVQDETGQELTLYQESYALLVGVSDYTSGWPDLPGVEDDIQTVKEILEEHGFYVVVEENPKRQRLDQAITEFIMTYGQQPGNRLVFYFAGHGHTLELAYGDDMGYIVPADAPNPQHNQAGFMAKAIDMQMIEVYARRIQSKHALFLFDSCFSGSIFSLSRAAPESITYKTASPVRQFITSGSANEQVPDESIFRRQLITGLKGEGDVNGDGYVTGTELGEFLQTTVVNYSRGAQHPQYGKIRHPILDKGDVVFQISGPVHIEQTMTISPEGDPEADMWEFVKGSSEIADFHDFLDAFPDGRFAKVARFRLKQLERQQASELPENVAIIPTAQIIFQDTFNSEATKARALFGNDFMAFTPRNRQGCLTAFQPNVVLPAMYPQPALDDFIVEMDVLPQNVSPGSQYGLIFRSDDESGGLAYYYLLNLQPAYDLVELWAWDADWAARAVLNVKTGVFAANGSNRIRVESRGSTFRVSINDIFVGEIQDTTLAKPGIFGLSLIAAKAPETVCFDNFAVSAIR